MYMSRCEHNLGLNSAQWKKIIEFDGWAVVHNFHINDASFSSDAERLFIEGIVFGQISSSRLDARFKKGPFYFNEVTCIVTGAYVYGRLNNSREIDRWEEVKPAPANAIQGIVLLYPDNLFEGFAAPQLTVESRLAAFVTMKQRAEILVNVMRKHDLPIPIYYSDGSLVWPQQLSPEEVRRLVA